MKHFFILLAAFLLFGCASPRKHFKRGDYEKTVYVAVKKIRAKPKRADRYGGLLQQAYTIQTDRWFSRIAVLEQERRPENALPIYRLYQNIDKMQREVLTVSGLGTRTNGIPLPTQDISSQLARYKSEAAQYLYEEAQLLLQENTKSNARLAHTKLSELLRLFPDYHNAKTLQIEAFERGQNHVLVVANNLTDYILPNAFMHNLTYYNPDGLNSRWTNFHTAESQREVFDYYVDIVIQVANISPEQIYEVRSAESRTVRDGWRYVLDGRGNVLKDSLGNDVREPNYIEIYADILAVEQTKAGIVMGEVVFSNAEGKLIQRWPFREELLFKNFFTNFTGDDRALSRETRERVGGSFVPFPTNLEMIMDASEVIKRRSHGLIRRNAHLLE
ncbi:MAG: hypothetical protein LAT76_03410 [Schleiferiaceae bacterium]|nr:hypothetical protein [Schleiferiaceae bacterium]